MQKLENLVNITITPYFCLFTDKANKNWITIKRSDERMVHDTIVGLHYGGNIVYNTWFVQQAILLSVSCPRVTGSLVDLLNELTKDEVLV